MAGNDIKQKIVLEGEKEYNQALKDAQRNLKTLRSELKAETAELGANATAQQKNEAKAKNLQKQIKEQEKVVKTYREALEEVKEKYGDNEDAVAKWEQKLNDARTALANMKNQLDQTGDSFQKIKSGASDSKLETYALAESFGKISSAAESMSTAMESIFGSVIGTLRTAIQSVWGELMEIAGKADNYMDLASFLGSSATDVQKWDRAMKAVGGDLSTITSMVSKLKYGGKDKKVTEWFGISGENYTDDLEYVQQVLQQMADMKEEMVAAGTWETAMGEIFGAKKVQEIDGVLSDWPDIIRALGEFDVENGGVGLSEEDLQTMTELYNEVGLLQEKWNAFKESVVAKMFGHLALDLTSNAQGALDALIAFMDADTQEERDKAIEAFKNNITEAFTKIGEAIQSAVTALNEVGTELQGSDNNYIKMLGDVLVALSNAMDWFTKPENIDTVIGAFETLAAFWLVGKGVDLVSTIASLAANIKIIGGSGVLGGGLGGLGGGGLGSVLTSAGYLAVGVMMVAPTVQKLLDPNFWNKEEKPEVEGAAEAVKEAGISTQDLLKTGFARAFYTGGDASGMATPKGNREKEEEKAPYNGPRSVDGVGIPVIRKPIELTAEQIEAAERFWDNWRNFKFTGQGEYSYDKAWDNFEKAFVGDESKFNLLNDLMDKFMASIDSAGVDGLRNYQDLPASWWMNPNGENNGLTSEDISGFRGLPAQMLQAVKSGSAAGVSGIKVTLDGRTVGMMVAPYVSEVIAREIQ